MNPINSTMDSTNPSIKLVAVGDIMLGDLPACFGFGVGSMIKRYGSNRLFSKIKKELTGADMLIGNLEAVLSDQNRQTLWPPSQYLRGDKKAINILKETGFSVLSVANNHMMQHGPAAFHETVELLLKAGINVAGLKDNPPFHSKPVILNVKGIVIGILGYSLRPEEYHPEDVLYCQGSERVIAEDIKRLRPDVDKVILLAHWGDEFIARPAPHQVKMARTLVDYGADLIIGHHPHVLQGIEQYKGGVIAYSLGNFIFDMWLPNTKQSIILKIDCNNNGVNEVDALPIEINDEYQPEAITGSRKTLFMEYFKGLCKQFDAYNMDETDYNVELKKCFQVYRDSTRFHYLKNLYRYNIFYLIEFLLIILLRRFFNKHI